MKKYKYLKCIILCCMEAACRVERFFFLCFDHHCFFFVHGCQYLLSFLLAYLLISFATDSSHLLFVLSIEEPLKKDSSLLWISYLDNTPCPKVVHRSQITHINRYHAVQYIFINRNGLGINKRSNIS